MLPLFLLCSSFIMLFWYLHILWFSVVSPSTGCPTVERLAKVSCVSMCGCGCVCVLVCFDPVG